MSLTNDEVLEKAQRWAFLHKHPENRGKMDAVINGLNAEDQRRVYLCGQRISGGLSPKVIPAADNHRKEVPKKHEPKKESTTKKSANAAPTSIKAVEKGKAVGASPRSKSGSRSRKNSGNKKQ
jgi:hypothetical protein